MEQQDWPITGVEVVADIGRCPAGYTTIDRTFDKHEDADLWRDGWFGSRVTRYMCVERCAPQPGKDVLVDVAVINDRDPVPPGFTVVDYTHDTRERAIKKRVMCVRWMSISITNSAISELILLSKGARRPPNGYTLVGELNSLLLCYKMANIKTQSSVANHNSDIDMANLSNSLPYSLNPGRETAYNQGSSEPASSGTFTRVGPPQRTLSSLSTNAVTPISGVAWQLSPKLTSMNQLKNINLPEIRYKSMMEIENEYSYHFDLEKTVN